MWFDLGLARLDAGDRDGAEATYGRGLDLVGRLEPARRVAPLLVARDDLREAMRERPALAARPNVMSILRRLEVAAATP